MHNHCTHCQRTTIHLPSVTNTDLMFCLVCNTFTLRNTHVARRKTRDERKREGERVKRIAQATVGGR